MNISEVTLKDYRCPICNNDSTDEIENKNPFGITLNQCKYCGFIFRAKWLDDKTFLEFSRHAHRSTPNYNYDQKEWSKFSTIYNLLPKLFEGDRKKIRHLDVGSGMGRALKKFGFDSIGLELCDSHYKYAKHRYGLDIRNTYDISEESFDFISCNLSLTYIPNIREFLDSLRNKLNKDGKLYISVPTMDHSGITLFKTGMALEYTSMFTTETFLNLLNVVGLQVELIDKTNMDYVVVCSRGETKNNFNRIYDSTKKHLETFLKTSTYVTSKNWDKIMEFNPNCYDAYIGAAQGKLEDFDYMHKLAEDLLERFPNRLPILATMGYFYYNHRHYDKAIELYTRASKIVWSYDIFYYLGLCHYDTGIYDRAAEYFIEAVKIHPLAGTEFEDKDHSLLRIIQSCYHKIKDH